MPKPFQITLYKCNYCDKTFKHLTDCTIHEKLEHRCRTCEHCYLVYGVEPECELKRCNYKERVNDERGTK